MRAWLRRHRPALALAVLSPAIAEVLSGSTKITLLFYSPFTFAAFFALLMLFYGGGALLVREAAVRWRKGWASVLLLGAAYGIVEEGLSVHTFFQPGGNPVGELGSFGRFGGTNLLWALGLTAYHAVISIALPILLVELMYPTSRGQRLLEGRSLPLVALGYLAVVGVFAATVPYFPPPPVFAVTVGVVAGLVAGAYRVPRGLLRPRSGPPTAGAASFVLAGTGLMVAWLYFGDSGPYLFPAAWMAGGAFTAALLAILWFVLRHAGTIGTSAPEYWFAAGMIGFFFAWDAILEFVLVPGILLVAAAFALYLYWLHRRLFVTASRRSIGAIAGPSGPA